MGSPAESEAVTNYRNGAELERAAKHLLEDNGYFVVKAGGSKGAADLVALKPGEILLVQCKTDGYLRPGERLALVELAADLAAIPLTGEWHKEGRAAREVRFRFAGGCREVWSPDWALEERTANG